MAAPVISLPPELAALPRRSPGGLTPCSVRLDAPTIAELDQLSEQLNGPCRAALLRHLIRVGMATVRAELEAAA